MGNTQTIWAVAGGFVDEDGHAGGIRLWAVAGDQREAVDLAEHYLGRRRWRFEDPSGGPVIMAAANVLSCDQCGAREFAVYMRPVDDDGKVTACGQYLGCARCNAHVKAVAADEPVDVAGARSKRAQAAILAAVDDLDDEVLS